MLTLILAPSVTQNVPPHSQHPRPVKKAIDRQRAPRKMGGPQGLVTSQSRPWRPTWSTAMLAVVLLLLGMTSATSGLRRCQRPPRFSVAGVEPMSLARGHVTLVALLSSTCPFCIQQAGRLETLYQGLRANGSDVHMMIINGGPPPDPGEAGVFEQLVSFDVYHDDNQQQIWGQVFQGNKDDMFVFNRCGMLTYRIRFPYSYLGYTYVPRALSLTASNRAICPACRPRRDPHDYMQADSPVAGRFGGGMAPSSGRSRSAAGGRGGGDVFQQQGRRRGLSSGHLYSGGARRRGSSSGRNLNRSRCPKDDDLCRELRRGRRRYNRFRSQHGLGQHSGRRMSEDEVLRLFAAGRRGGGRGQAGVGPVA